MTTTIKTKTAKCLMFGLLSSKEMFKPIVVRRIYDDTTVGNVKKLSLKLVMDYGSVREVYCIPNREGIMDEFHEARRLNSIESCIIFRDILQHEGVLVRVHKG